MNNTRWFFFFGAFLIFLSTSCEKEEGLNFDPTNLALGTFTGTFDGREFSTTFATATGSQGTSGTYLSVNALEANLGSVSYLVYMWLNFPEEVTIAGDTYSSTDCSVILNNDCIALGYVATDGTVQTGYSSTDEAGSLTVRISRYEEGSEPKISGTFTGTLVDVDTDDPIPVTDGRFNLPITFN